MDDSDLLLVDDAYQDDDSLVLLGEELPPSVNGTGKPSRDGASVLARLDQQIQERYQREQERVDKMYTKREVERAHSQYLQQNVSSPLGRAEANLVVGVWSRKNGSNVQPPNPRRMQNPPRARQQIPDTRGYSSTSTSRMSTTTGMTSNATSMTRGEEFCCPVLNCQARFRRRSLLEKHMTNFMHTPCHPLLHLVNMKLDSEIENFICPVCGNTYREFQPCMDHMQAVGHGIAAVPLRIGAYACPQCLLLFSCKPSCSVHMKDNRHTNFNYPFADDLSKEPRPIPFPSALVEEFCDSCASQSWYMECVNCECKVFRGKEGQEHFNKKHSIVAFASTTPADVFSKFLCAYTCVQCLCLFEDLSAEGLGDVHQCTADIMGMIVENDCKTFEEFVLRTALTCMYKTKHPGKEQTKNCVDIGSSTDCMIDPEREFNSGNKNILESNKTSNLHQTEVSETNLCQKAGASKAQNIGRREPTNLNYKKNDSKNESLNTVTKISKKVTKTLRDEIRLPDETKSNRGEDSRSTFVPDIEISKCTLKDFKIPKRRDVVHILEDSSQNEDAIPRKRRRKENYDDDSIKLGIKSKHPLDLVGNKHRHCILEADNDTKFSSKRSLINGGSRAWKKNVSALRVLTGENPAVTNCNGQYMAIKAGMAAMPKHINMTAITVPGYDSNSALDSICNIGESTLGRINASLIPNSTATRTVSTSRSSNQNNQVSIPVPRRAPPQGPVHVPYSYSGPAETMSRKKNSDPENLDFMKHIVFVDLDNWAGFFSRLPGPLPAETFVWGFYGGGREWREPYRVPAFEVCKSNGWFHLHNKCGFTKDAADFAICLQVGRMDERLPEHIPFTILSGDRGFCELERQMQNSSRRAVVINPHHKTPEMVHTLIMSVGDA